MRKNKIKTYLIFSHFFSFFSFFLIWILNNFYSKMWWEKMRKNKKKIQNLWKISQKKCKSLKKKFPACGGLLKFKEFEKKISRLRRAYILIIKEFEWKKIFPPAAGFWKSLKKKIPACGGLFERVWKKTPACGGLFKFFFFYKDFDWWIESV